MIAHDVSQAEHERVQRDAALLSVVTPAYNEARNLPLLYERLGQVLAGLSVAWEWIVVDDHSADGTFAVVASIAQRDSRVRAIRLVRNSGSHTAITCGLHQASGDCAVILAADLQDQPEPLLCPPAPDITSAPSLPVSGGGACQALATRTDGTAQASPHHPCSASASSDEASCCEADGDSATDFTDFH